MGKKEIINPGWSHYQRYTFSPAVRRGNLLFISGQTAVDEKGEVVGKGDIVAQTRCIYENIGKILEAAGATFDNIVMTTDYIISAENYKETAQVRREYFKKDFPAATGVIVKALLKQDILIEIDAIAVLD
jgi:reactive intermediate/imine deaminase